MKINSLDKLIDLADDTLELYCDKYDIDFEVCRKKIETIIDPIGNMILLDFYLDYYSYVMKNYKL